jgi:hypothetical protein
MIKLIRLLFFKEDSDKKLIENIKQYEANRKVHSNKKNKRRVKN